MPHDLLVKFIESLDPEAGSLTERLALAIEKDAASLRSGASAVRRRFDEAVEFAREFQLRRGVKPVKFDRASRDAATLLFEAGAVSSVDDGIVLFHERLAQDNPSLRKLFRRADMRAGRLTVARPSPAQRAVREVLKGALVSRDAKGRMTIFSGRAKALIRKAKDADRAIQREREGKQREAARKRLIALGKRRKR